MGEEAEYLNETLGVDYEFSKYVHEKNMERTSNYSANDGSRVRSRRDCGGYCANCWKNCSKKRTKGGKMSLGTDHYSDTAYDREFGIRYTENLDELTELTDNELIAKAISTGPGLDKYEHFPAYTVAMKMRTYGWRISSKQREAMRNCLAYYLSERDM